MADLSCSHTNRKSSSFATKHFQSKSRTSSAAERVSTVCGTNNHVKSEMLSNRHTHEHTATQIKYCSSRCACVPRVNYYIKSLTRHELDVITSVTISLYGCVHNNVLIVEYSMSICVS